MHVFGFTDLQIDMNQHLTSGKLPFASRTFFIAICAWIGPAFETVHVKPSTVKRH